jgi:hypothetical protein
VTTKHLRHTPRTPNPASKPQPASSSATARMTAASTPAAAAQLVQGDGRGLPMGSNGWRAPVHGHRGWRPLAPPTPGVPALTSSWRKRPFGR